MPTMISAVLLAALAPAATDRTAASVEVEAAPAAPVAAPVAAPAAPADDGPVDPWSSATTPSPAPAAVPPPAAAATGVVPYGSPGPARARERAKPPDRPIRWRFDLLGAFGTTRIGDVAWRAFDFDRGALHVSGTARADFRLGDGRVFLGGGLTYRRFAGFGSAYGTLQTDAWVREPLAFLRASVVVVEGVDVVVQAGGGPSVVDLGFVSGEFADQREVVGMIDALGGVALYLPKRWLPRRDASRMALGLELGAGYTWRGELDVRPTPSTDSEPIPTTGAPLGDLAIRGVAWRLGLFLRFQ